MKELQLRSQVPEELKWDLTRIYSSESDYEKAVDKMNNLSIEFVENYKGKINNSEILLLVMDKYEELITIVSLTNNYSQLDFSTDMTDEMSSLRSQKCNNVTTAVMERISFLENEILAMDDREIDKAIENTNKFKVYISRLKDKKPYMLFDESEKLISALSPSLTSFYRGYEDTKLADMDFPSFEANGKVYANSFVLYENHYQHETDTEVRRTAFREFSKVLNNYRHTVAGYYANQVQTEKIIANLRGYKSVFDYLLFEQKVDKTLYNRQIDLIMKYLAPHMRRYAKLIQNAYGLEKMTFADLKLPLIKEYTQKISIEEAKEYVYDALSVMGSEYMEIVDKAYSDKWIDYASNKGKSTGGFCASPYKKGSYILLSWTEALSDVFTLVHEIGHGCHFELAQRNNSILEEEPSMYFIEAPSTMNELLLGNSLMKKNESKKFRQYVLSVIIGQTYFHNFVTHLLEAAYQREVYNIIDNEGGITPNILSEIKGNILKEFWGESVEIDDDAKLTWMRQPHYYMGLYSYTYSAGLTVATAMAKRINNEEKDAVSDWEKVLKAGGTKDVIELGKLAGLDLNSDKPLMDTIEYLGHIIDELEG